MGNTILTGSEDGTTRLWDLKGDLIQEFKGHTKGVKSAIFLHDGNKIFTGSDDGTIRLWDLKGISNSLVFAGHTGKVQSVCIFTLRGFSILTVSEDSTIRLWNRNGNSLKVFRGHTNTVYLLHILQMAKLFFPDRWIATACLWDLEGNTIQVFRGHEGFIHSAVFSSNRRFNSYRLTT